MIVLDKDLTSLDLADLTELQEVVLHGARCINPMDPLGQLAIEALKRANQEISLAITCLKKDYRHV